MKPFNPERHIIPRYAHAKLDGNGVSLELTPRHRPRLLTATGADIWRAVEPWVPHLDPQVHAVVSCELCSPNGFEDVKSAIAEGRQVTLHPFATSVLPADAPLDDVACWCHDVLQLDIPVYFDRHEYDGPVMNDDAWLSMLALDALERKVEGWVFKDGNYAGCLKWKAVKTIDLVVTGATDGDGKYLGLLGSLELSTTEGYRVANCSGMDDSVRCELTHHWCNKTLIGKVVEVSYDRVTSKGRLRFPRFKRVRDDKLSSDCRVDQDNNLEEYYGI